MKRESLFIKYRLHHVLFWLLVFGIWYFFRYDGYYRRSTAFWVTFIKVVDLALMVYITNYILLPKLLYRKKYGWFALAFVVLVTSSSIFKMKILGWLTNAPALQNIGSDLKGRIYDNVLPHFFLVIAGAFIKILFDYARLQQRMTETAKEKAEAELNFLKSQINPHFLFNSLNAVYFLIDKNNGVARESLHKFSDMLRYQLYEVNGARIPVEREIHYLKDYVDLQKLRRDEHYSVSFSYSPQVSGFSIEPLLLIPFVENAFKHVSAHPSGGNFVNITLGRENGEFVFSATNSKEERKQTDPYSGIGLNNVKRRLELLYPGKHSLQIRDEEGSYDVQLKLKIDE